MTENESNAAAFFRVINNPLKFTFFLIQKLPAAWIAGLKLVHADANSCKVSIPYRWLTQNPFRSMYFASMSMAAELTTGVLAMANIWKRKPPVSMLITGMEAKFLKKATSRIYLTCADGPQLNEAVRKAVQGEPNVLTVKSVARTAADEIVAEFYFTWSFKARV
jgi:hypothetical protein